MKAQLVSFGSKLQHHLPRTPQPLYFPAFFGEAASRRLVHLLEEWSGSTPQTLFVSVSRQPDAGQSSTYSNSGQSDRLGFCQLAYLPSLPKLALSVTAFVRFAATQAPTIPATCVSHIVAATYLKLLLRIRSLLLLLLLVGQPFL
jgi:hypothetical protein